MLLKKSSKSKNIALVAKPDTQQTESAVIFTDQDLLPRLTSIIQSMSEEKEGGGMRVRFIVYYENSYEKHFERPRVADSGITLYPYSDLRTVGVDTTSACQVYKIKH